MGRNHFLKKGRKKKQSFCFQNSVFSVSHFPPFGCARFAHQMNLLSLESYILFLYPWLKFGMWLFQFPPHLKKIIWSFKEKNGKNLWKNWPSTEKKTQVKKNHGSKYAIFFVCYFLEYCAKTVAKIVENKMAVFLWRKKNRKEKKMKENPPNKKWLPVFTSWQSTDKKNDNCAFLKIFCVILWFTINFSLSSRLI